MVWPILKLFIAMDLKKQRLIKRTPWVWFAVGLAFIVLAGLSACLPAATPLPPLPTNTQLPPTATATATIVWFPSTPTYTPFPTPVITPTLDVRPEQGNLLIKEDFSNPENWTLGRANQMSVALGKNELSLAISKPGGYLYTLYRQAVPNDFYIEVTASPSLCKDKDEYGLLLRVSPSLEFYRFSLSCDGEVRLDKYFKQVASSPQPWTLSGAVPPGAPSSSRIGVQAQGKTMQFFVNGQFQFSVQDPSLTGGSLGFFARSANDTAVTVSFSDLEIYQP
jgi:hypothetical protein